MICTNLEKRLNKMPSGVYRREQEVTGYKSKNYFKKMLKERLGNVCSVCLLPSRKLVATGNTVANGKLYCYKCHATNVFGQQVVMASATDYYSWARFLPRPVKGYIPKSLLGRITLLRHYRREPPPFTPYEINGVERGEPISLTIIGQLDPIRVRMPNGIATYNCLVATDGSVLLKKEKSNALENQ